MTAYEMRIRDWSSYVCSSDLRYPGPEAALAVAGYPRTGGFSEPAHLSSIPVRERYRGDRMDLSAICRSLASLPLATVVSCALLAAPVLAASVPVESAGDVVGVVKSVQGSVFIERSGDATNPVPGSPVDRKSTRLNYSN